MIFVDSNIVIDLIQDGEWTAWAKRRLAQGEEPLVANHIVFAEVAPSFVSANAEEIFFQELGIALAPISARIAHAAGRAHLAYRLQGGGQRSILADFLIGAHAADLGAALITRDRRRFATYFPDLTLITPETQP